MQQTDLSRLFVDKFPAQKRIIFAIFLTVCSVGSISEVMLGLKDFFDATVHDHLLYKCEKAQYMEKVGKAKINPSDAYGSAHLLRLMSKIGPFLNRYNVFTSAESNVNFIENIIMDFLNFLEENRTRYFTSRNYTDLLESESLNSKEWW